MLAHRQRLHQRCRTQPLQLRGETMDVLKVTQTTAALLELPTCRVAVVRDHKDKGPGHELQHMRLSTAQNNDFVRCGKVQIYPVSSQLHGDAVIDVV